ncbi:MAG: prepilin-type N-terminal cleavage/methylation domain-containing protein [Endomicrobium sp.]|nr:prepilin-type N-terminal cleavage/methylation domain-containing protein [Endomicrobium sp.]
MKKNYGFTLVELVMVIVIVAILAFVSVPIYRGNVERSYTLEGMALLNEAAAAQEIFKDRYGRFWGDGTVGDENATTNIEKLKKDLGVDARRNYYFKEIAFTEVSPAGTRFVVTASADLNTKARGIVMSLTWTDSAAPKITAKITDSDGNVRPIKGYVTD